MLIDLAKMAKIHKFGLANSLLDSPMATWLTLTRTLGKSYTTYWYLVCYSSNCAQNGYQTIRSRNLLM